MFRKEQTSVRCVVLGVAGVLLVACSHASLRQQRSLVFLTRHGCVNTPEMEMNVDDALRALKLPLDYAVIDIGTLPKTDPRTGYPTPTVLWRGADLFGMPESPAPFPEPS